MTLPERLRDELGIGPGGDVSFDLRESGLLQKASDGRGRAVVAGLRGRGDVAMTTDEIMALTRDASPVPSCWA